MPTGYTADLEARKYDVKGWLKENVIRAMGVCVTLRDEGKMTVKQIMEALKKEESESYHAKRLRESQEAMIEFKKLNPEKLQARYQKERDKAKLEFIKRKQEFDTKKASHLNAIAETSALYNSAVAEKQGEVIVNTLKFALDQLNQTLNFDYGSGPYREEILDQSFEDWKLATRKKLLWDIDYHGKELPKEESRNFDRHNEYKKYVDWIDSK